MHVQQLHIHLSLCAKTKGNKANINLYSMACCYGLKLFKKFAIFEKLGILGWSIF